MIRYRDQPMDFADATFYFPLDFAFAVRRVLRAVPRQPPPPPVVRYERAAPGEWLHLDIKKLGRSARVGPRITGDPRDHTRGAGWECVQVCIDDHSRVAYVEVRPDEKKESAVARLGVGVQRVMTDNGSGYKSAAFRKACGTCAPGPTRPRPTAKPSASSSRRCTSGLTPSRMPTPTNAPPHSSTGGTDITGIGPTVHYTAYHPSAGSTWGTTS
mgnify:CR=1 FL=1